MSKNIDNIYSYQSENEEFFYLKNKCLKIIQFI